MPKYTDKEYYINNVAVNIWNFIKYLCYLKTYGIIPEFSVSNDINNLYIQTIYTDYNGKWKKSCISLIKYKCPEIIEYVKSFFCCFTETRVIFSRSSAFFSR